LHSQQNTILEIRLKKQVQDGEGRTDLNLEDVRTDEEVAATNQVRDD
jgi:hypothetical protein